VVSCVLLNQTRHHTNNHLAKQAVMDPTFEDEVQQIAKQIVQEEQAVPVVQVVYHVFRTHKPAPPPATNPT
jgi:hypothetical protein